MPWRFLWRIFCFRKLLGSFYSAAVVLSRISECRRYLLPRYCCFGGPLQEEKTLCGPIAFLVFLFFRSMSLSPLSTDSSLRLVPSTLRLLQSVKRSLKLDGLLEENSFDPSKITRKKSVITYSPTTGTCQMSLFASPTSSEEQKHRNGLSNEKRKKLNHPSLTESKESTTKDNDEFMMLLSKVEKLSEEIMEIMQNLSSIQALEGSRELENLIGISCASHFLKREMQKTKELMTKVNKQKLFEKSTGLPHKESRHLDSYEFLKAILN
ncbi:centromere protein R isoform X3 [Pan troglodytes]|uniref:centromere protein R isoform X3 n=1 Tax=Pan troglodytes TaxID=9598 RepID=UPI0030133430